jgi:hypothetical protein
MMVPTKLGFSQYLQQSDANLHISNLENSGRNAKRSKKDFAPLRSRICP